MVVSELRGEKIDIIPHNDEPARFVAKALSPARVREVLVDDENKQATVVVPDDQLSLAIGKEGQNARLAARLTGWRVDIKSETEFAEVEEELGLESEDDMTGRCQAVLSTGRRCPNAALAGSRYCGLPAHQALAEQVAEETPPDPAPVEAEPEAVVEAAEPTDDGVPAAAEATDEVVEAPEPVEEEHIEEPAAEEPVEQPVAEEPVEQEAPPVAAEEPVDEVPAPDVEEAPQTDVAPVATEAPVAEAPVESEDGGDPSPQTQEEA
jgi:N utilization substance protein A